MAATRSVMIFGASRGIGLGLAEEFSRREWRVIASERTRSEALHALHGVEVVTADVTDPLSYADIGASSERLDAVVINAGILGARHQSADQASSEEVAEVMMANAFGPVRAGRSLLPRLKRCGTLAFMSSLMGSIADSTGGYELYRSSKAALNMLAKGLSEQEAKAGDVEVLSLHPGWVQTDMGGPNATLTVAQSVAGLADVIEAAGGAGYRFVDYTGKTLPF